MLNLVEKFIFVHANDRHMHGAQDSQLSLEQRVRNMRLVAVVGILGDAIIACIFTLLRPLGTDIDYYIAALTVAAGVYMFIMFYWFFPKRMKNQASPDVLSKN